MHPVDHNPSSTQRHAILGIEAELEAEGFEHAELIGRGGFGAVFRCTERALTRPVAVKVLRPGYGNADLERFLREQRSMGLLSGHPNIVTVLHVDVTATGEPYLVLPFCSRGSLHDAIKDSGPLDAASALAIGVKLAGALETAHRRGILHRDVKPPNVLISDYGEPQLCDFGIAHLVGDFETGTGEVTGSPAYTAPEVLLGRSSTVRSDIYGLGATLFTVLSGHVPFERSTGENVVSHFVRLTRDPLGSAELPQEIGPALAEAMSPEPSQRPASAAEFGEILRQVQRRMGFPVTEMPIAAAAGGDSSALAHAPAPEPSRPSAAVPPAPNTRFRPMRAPRELVPRPRLARLLSRGERKRLTLIHAPAGFGKSCAAVQLAEQLAESGVRIAWLTIGSDDNNGVTFCTHLIDALQRVDPGFDSQIGLALQEAGSEGERFALTAMINDIHRRKQQTAVVIDDWDAVTSEATRADLRFLLDQACHHLQLIVTTRTRSGLELGSLRVHDELVEIDSAALRFTTEEAQALLSRTGGIAMDRREAARLTESTEGWVAALQLAAVSLRHDQADPAELLDAISGSHYAIGEFLAENVLNSLEPELVEFMMATALPRRVCAGLAATLAQVTDGQSMLELVEERNLFLRRLDENGEWFRYHHLFADYLQRRLERTHRERIPELHRRAAEWFAEHDQLGDAVTHALIAGDDERAAQWVESAGLRLLEQGQATTLLALADSLPDEATAHRPHLLIVIALAAMTLRQNDTARTAIGRASVALDAAADIRAAEDLRDRCRLIEGVSAMLADRTEGTAELIAAPLADPDRFEPWYTAAAAVVAAYLDIARFDFEAAKTCRERAARYLADPSSQLSKVYAYCMSAIAAHEQLDIRAADYFLRKAMRVAMTGRRKPGLAARLAGALLGEILYERNEVTEAETYLDAAFELGATLGAPDFMIACYVTGARAKAALGKFEEARDRLAAGMRVAEEQRLPRLAAHIIGEQICLGGTGLSALQLTDDSREPTGTGELTRDAMRYNFIQLALLPDSGIAPEVAATAAQQLADKMTDQARPRALAAANLLLAQCLSKTGQIARARRLAAATTAGLTEIGLLRPILDAGPPLWALLTDPGTDPSIPPLPESVFRAIADEDSARRTRRAAGS
ncbi:serine/threonine-protein kinase [Nocardia miyunensis]|uniref:serine/threonine-protein kinase n=1 Tax=Nocardia miyunensis TaxID=282684 RepID=UPI0008369DAE|nr:serine/threonine-protein kinase [Nocardia miyunensis]